MPQAVGAVFYALYVAAVVLYTYENHRKAKNAGKKKYSRSDPARGHMINKRSNQEPIPLIYGRTKVGINEAYIGTTGTDAKTLHIIGIIGEGEINGIAQTGGVDQLFLDGKIYTEYGANVSYEVFTGTSTQAVCSTLHTAIPAWNDPLRYTAYIYISLQYDGDKFQGKPDITLEVEGLKVYNPDTAVTEYSNNPALCARDFITRSSRRGGREISSSRLLDSSIEEAAAYCTDKGWTCDIPIFENRECVDNLREILDTFRASFIYSENVFKMPFADLDYETSCMSLTDEDIVERNGKSSLRVVQPSIYDTPNAIRIKFLNAEKKYVLDDYVLSDTDAMAADGDYREETLTIRGISSYTNAMKMANYHLEKERINKEAALECHSRCIALEPFDVIDITSAAKGWDAKYFRVAKVNYDGQSNVSIEVTEEDDIFYDDTYNIESHSYHDTTLPVPFSTVPPVINVSSSEEQYTYRERTFTRWKINFDKPAAEDYPFWECAEIHLKIGSGDWKYMTRSGGDYQVDPVEEGETYYCRMVSVSIFGTKQAFADGYTISRVIIGKTELPSDLSSLTAIAAGDTVNIYANNISDNDVSVYELRLGDAWDGGLYIASNESPNFRLVGVRPGTHPFWCKAKDNSGNYSENAVSAVVEVFYPPSYADVDTWAWDYDAIGTHDNTEHTTYSGSDALKCSHTDDVLTGTWLSPEYDFGSKIKVRVWGDFLSAFASSDGYWEDVVPVADTWEDLVGSTTRWSDFLAIVAAGNISAKLYWGDTTGSLTNSADKLEILGIEIEARYVQVEITITDPDLGSNLYLKTLNMVAAYW